MRAHPPMVVAAARVLSRRAADECNVDAGDHWNLYADTYLADAQAALDAAGMADMLAALKLAYRHLNGGSDSLSATEHAQAFSMARAAIATATAAEPEPEPIPAGEATDSDFGAFEDAAR